MVETRTESRGSEKIQHLKSFALLVSEESSAEIKILLTQMQARDFQLRRRQIAQLYKTLKITGANVSLVCSNISRLLAVPSKHLPPVHGGTNDLAAHRLLPQTHTRFSQGTENNLASHRGHLPTAAAERNQWSLVEGENHS